MPGGVTRPYEVSTADALLARTFAGTWRRRETIGADAREALREILEAFVADGGPVPLASLDARRRESVALLDAEDLVAVTGGAVVLAYPFSAAPTGFAVTLPGGRQRHACCAIDALGVAPLLGRPARVRARCHRSGAPIDLDVAPAGVRGDPGIMVWVGERRDVREKSCASL